MSDDENCEYTEQYYDCDGNCITDIDCNNIVENTYNTYGIASLESVPVTVVTGAPAFGQINYSYVEISPIGG